MDKSWSEKLSEKFFINLPYDLIEWFDKGLWDQSSYDINFGEPISPESIMEDRVWGGLMLPDTLPILDNGCGDSICVRFDQAGVVKEYIKWSHEGCGWIPYGKSLAEAIIIDYAVSRIQMDNDPDQSFEVSKVPFIEWALQTLDIPDEKRKILQTQFANRKPFKMDYLIEANIMEEPCRVMLAESCLQSKLLTEGAYKLGGGAIAEQLGITWVEFSEWLGDTDLIPPSEKDKLSHILNIPSDELFFQNWKGAVEQAENIITLRNDLSWPYAVLGRSAEREKNFESAAKFYLAGIRALGTTQDFTETWNKMGSGINKYCVQQLIGIQDILNTDLAKENYFSAAKDTDAYSVYEFWRNEAEITEKDGDFSRSYTCWYNAGWDEHGSDNMNVILEGLVRSAKNSGYDTLYKLAAHHYEAWQATQF